MISANCDKLKLFYVLPTGCEGSAEEITDFGALTNITSPYFVISNIVKLDCSYRIKFPKDYLIKLTFAKYQIEKT